MDKKKSIKHEYVFVYRGSHEKGENKQTTAASCGL